MSRNFKKSQILLLAVFLIFSFFFLNKVVLADDYDPNNNPNNYVPDPGGSGGFIQKSDQNNPPPPDFNRGGGGVNSAGSVKISNPLGVTSFVGAISKILDYLIYISIPILALMILWGGFQILTAREAPEKIKNGKTTIMWAVVGFIIILASKGMALIFIEVLGT
jgi:hypothetical protein